MRDLVALQEGRDALHAATTTLKERVTVAEGAISDGLATIGTVEDSVNETYVSLSETVGANAALLEAAGGVKEQVEADIESAQTKSASDSKLHLKVRPSGFFPCYLVLAELFGRVGR